MMLNAVSGETLRYAVIAMNGMATVTERFG
jgi:hypothetical protein